MGRTFAPLAETDLGSLWSVADDELRRFLEEAGTPRGKYGGYRDRLLAVCLVQGAAQHFVDTRVNLKPDHQIELDQVKIHEKGYVVTDEGRVISGVKDIDILFFFRNDIRVPIPNIKHCRKETYWKPSSELGERRFDLMKKGLSDHLAFGEIDPQEIVRRYLEKTNHGHKYLAKKSIVGLHPPSIFAKPLWITHRWARGRLPELDDVAT